MNTDEKILNILVALQEGQEQLEKRADRLDNTQSRILTAVEAIAAGQKDMATKQHVEGTVQAAKIELISELASKADVLDLGAKIDKNTTSIKTRLEELEKDAGIHNRDKN